MNHLLEICAKQAAEIANERNKKHIHKSLSLTKQMNKKVAIHTIINHANKIINLCEKTDDNQDILVCKSQLSNHVSEIIKYISDL